MAQTFSAFGRRFDKRLLWLVFALFLVPLMLLSAFFTKLVLFLALLIFCALFVYFNTRLHVPVDITPLTFCLLIIGYYYSWLWVIVFFILGSLIPGILGGSGIGPTSFIYIPLNIGLGIIFPIFAGGSLVFSIFVFLMLYAFLIFLIDGVFFSSFARSLLMAFAFLLGSLVYLAAFWRLQGLFGF